MGGVTDPSLELLLAVAPDLVVTWRGITDPAAERALGRAGIPVYRAWMEDVADVLRTARELGALVGRETAGRALASEIAADLQAVAHRSEGRGVRPGVAIVVDPASLLVAGSGTFLDEVLTAAGGHNVFADATGAWPRVSPETLLARQPDALIVAAAPGAPHALKGALWDSLRAVAQGRVLWVDRDRLLQPGPDVAELARTLSRFLDDA